MKHFQHPYDIEIKPWAEVLRMNPEATSEKVSFLKWFTFIVANDARAIQNEKGEQVHSKTKRWFKVTDKIQASKPGDFITVDDEDFATLRRIVETPTLAFQNAMPLNLACTVFADAILDAKDELPAAVAQA